MVYGVGGKNFIFLGLLWMERNGRSLCYMLVKINIGYLNCISGTFLGPQNQSKKILHETIAIIHSIIRLKIELWLFLFSPI